MNHKAYQKMIIAGFLLVMILAITGPVQAAGREVSTIFTTPYNGLLFFCLSTNPPEYNNCVQGYRQIRVYAPEPPNGLYIHSCFQFVIWICDNGFWMTEQDVWYTETEIFPHLKWTSGGVVQSYTETPEVWNKLLMGYNRYIPVTFGPWDGPHQPEGYPAPERMEGFSMRNKVRAYP